MKKGQANLSWRRPKSDGGSEIFTYIVEYRAEGAFKWIRATSDHVPETTFMVKKLESDIMYEFRVTAENKAGTGPPSDPTEPVHVQERVGELECVVDI